MSKVKNDFALVFDEEGMSGLNILMFTSEVPDTEADIKSALRDKSDDIAGKYFLDDGKIKDMIQYLKGYRRKVKLYREYLLIYKGYKQDGLLETIISGVLKGQRDNVKEESDDTFNYWVGGDLTLFVPDCRTDQEAAEAVTEAWELDFGPLELWGIERQEKRDSYFITQSFESALKFDLFLMRRYRIPVLVTLGIDGQK